MIAKLEKVFGYRGDTMHLPVLNVASAVPYYETVLGFRVVSRGGDPAQDGCAFHVRGLPALFAEFTAQGLAPTPPEFSTEHRDGAAWTVGYVVAPDGLCYWFGERAS